MEQTTISGMLQQLAELKLKKEAVEAELKDLNKELEVLEGVVYDHFTEEGISGTKVPGLGAFSAREDKYYSIPEEKRDEVYAAFKAYYPDMVKETVNAMTLKGFMSDAEKNGTPLPAVIAEGVTVYRKKKISFRRS